MVNRVHVRDGHSLSISVRLARAPAGGAEEVAAALARFRPALPELCALPSAPEA
jgi:aspartate-semialdehyde dehydrogenase